MAHPLLEREAELGALAGALTRARRGDGGLVVVEGAAGAGKSALLRWLAQEADDALVRTASAAELEREFAFGVVHQLLDPVLRAAGTAERRRLLAGAAAAVGPLFGVGEPDGAGGADASFAVLHGLYWLVAALAETQPVVLVVDDAHWADEPSLRWCEFLARRAADLPLLLVLGLRPGEGPAADDLLAVVEPAVLLRPAPLGLEATRTLLDDATGEPVEEAVAHSALTATGGNPLLVTELARTLAAWDGAPTAAVVEAAVPSSVARSVQRRLHRLDPAAQRTAAALAVLGGRLPPAVLALAAGVGDAELEPALRVLRGAGLLEDAEYVHPLIRQAVVDGVPAGERTGLHRLAAEELHRRGGMEEQVVAHLLAAPGLELPWAADVLRAAGTRALADGAAEPALRRLRRAAEVAGAAADPALLVQCATAAIAAGDPRAVDHLLGAQRDAGPVAAGALALQILIDAHDAPRRLAALQRSVALIEGPEDGLVEPLRTQLLWATLNALTFDPALPEERARLLALAQAAGHVDHLPTVALHAAGSGATAAATTALVATYAAEEGSLGPPGMEGGNAWSAVVAAIVVDAPDAARPLLDRLERAGARGASRIAAYMDGLLRGRWELEFGSLPLAEALLRGALERCDELTDRVLERSARAELLGALVRLGRLDDAEALVADAAGTPDDDLTAYVRCSWWARRAELRAAQGRWPEAVADLRRVGRLLPGWGWDRFPVGDTGPLLATALIETQAVAEGEAVAQQALEDARKRGVARDEALALLALARAADAEAALDLRTTAVEAAGSSSSLVTRAGAQLELGGALRRAGQRKAARDVLAAARETASRAGAAGVLARATEELAVAGGRPHRVAVSGVAALTPSERRVAEHAARGLSNREIAEALFVTRKTVEFTLGRVFAKLGIRSRAQLPEHLH